MPLIFKKGTRQLLKVGTSLASSTACCCATCDSTTAQACCTYTTVAHTGYSTITSNCQSPKTECQCNDLGGTTFLNCTSGNCCIAGTVCMEGSISPCDCSLNSGVIISNCANCNDTTTIPTDPGTVGGGGPGTGGTGSPCVPPHVPIQNNDCVICSWGVGRGGCGYSYDLVQRYKIRTSKSLCESVVALFSPRSAAINTSGGCTNWLDLLMYWSMSPLTCVAGSSQSFVSEGDSYYWHPQTINGIFYPGYYEQYPSATVNYTCSCTC